MLYVRYDNTYTHNKCKCSIGFFFNNKYKYSYIPSDQIWPGLLHWNCKQTKLLNFCFLDWYNLCYVQMKLELHLEPVCLRRNLSGDGVYHGQKIEQKFAWNFVCVLQKRRQAEVAKKMPDNIAVDPIFIKRIITGDETWVYEYDVETVEKFNVMLPKRAETGKTKIS